MKTIFINLLAFGTLLSSVFTITSKNPVISVIFLISTFVSGAGYLILIGVNFVGLSYIIVYVGAIAVLFLFVIMMINIKLSDILETGSQYTKNLPLAISIGSLFIFIIFSVIPYSLNNVPAISMFLDNITYLNTIFASVLGDSSDKLLSFDVVNTIFKNNSIFSLPLTQSSDSLITQFQQIESLGYSLYTYGAALLITLSIILLLAMYATLIISGPSNIKNKLNRKSSNSSGEANNKSASAEVDVSLSITGISKRTTNLKKTAPQCSATLLASQTTNVNTSQATNIFLSTNKFNNASGEDLFKENPNRTKKTLSYLDKKILVAKEVLGNLSPNKKMIFIIVFTLLFLSLYFIIFGYSKYHYIVFSIYIVLLQFFFGKNNNFDNNNRTLIKEIFELFKNFFKMFLKVNMLFTTYILIGYFLDDFFVVEYFKKITEAKDFNIKYFMPGDSVEDTNNSNNTSQANSTTTSQATSQTTSQATNNSSVHPYLDAAKEVAIEAIDATKEIGKAIFSGKTVDMISGAAGTSLGLKVISTSPALPPTHKAILGVGTATLGTAGVKAALTGLEQTRKEVVKKADSLLEQIAKNKANETGTSTGTGTETGTVAVTGTGTETPPSPIEPNIINSPLEQGDNLSALEVLLDSVHTLNVLNILLFLFFLYIIFNNFILKKNVNLLKKFLPVKYYEKIDNYLKKVEEYNIGFNSLIFIINSILLVFILVMNLYFTYNLTQYTHGYVIDYILTHDIKTSFFLFNIYLNSSNIKYTENIGSPHYFGTKNNSIKSSKAHNILCISNTSFNSGINLNKPYKYKKGVLESAHTNFTSSINNLNEGLRKFARRTLQVKILKRLVF